MAGLKDGRLRRNPTEPPVTVGFCAVCPRRVCQRSPLGQGDDTKVAPNVLFWTRQCPEKNPLHRVTSMKGKRRCQEKTHALSWVHFRFANGCPQNTQTDAIALRGEVCGCVLWSVRSRAMRQSARFHQTRGAGAECPTLAGGATGEFRWRCKPETQTEPWRGRCAPPG